ncbi:hypothetical protein [Catenuloplanes japonicus]|uniref:hypothetical protein n=1 Tax=Catenuloplanes japonicus TaxID=33876 RepID=UPI0005266443|nr:hypothetical protein [Catenuloplanes japonicus]
MRALRWAVEPQAAGDLEVIAVDGQGWTYAGLPVESADVAYTQILAPADLRARMREAATLTAALYR